MFFIISSLLSFLTKFTSDCAIFFKHICLPIEINIYFSLFCFFLDTVSAEFMLSGLPLSASQVLAVQLCTIT